MRSLDDGALPKGRPWRDFAVHDLCAGHASKWSSLRGLNAISGRWCSTKWSSLAGLECDLWTMALYQKAVPGGTLPSMIFGQGMLPKARPRSLHDPRGIAFYQNVVPRGTWKLVRSTPRFPDSLFLYSDVFCQRFSPVGTFLW